MSFTASIAEIVSKNANGLLGSKPTWNRAPLGEVCSILNGAPFPSEQFSPSIGTPLIRIRDVVRGRTETFLNGPFDPAYLVQRADLLVGMDGDFNCALWSGEPALLNQRVCKVTPDERRIHRKFLRYVLPGYLSAINANTSAITVKHLSSRTLAEVPLPLPPMSEQLELIAYLDEQLSRLDASVAALHRVQANLKRYRASVLKSACEGRLVPTEAELARQEGRNFETGAQLLQRAGARRADRSVSPPETKGLLALSEAWTLASVDMVGDILLGRQRAPQYLTGESTHGYLRVANIKDDRIDFDDLNEMDFDSSHFAKYRLEPGDILVSEGQSPELLGQSAIFHGYRKPLCFQKTLHRFRAYVGLVMPEFAQLVFRSHLYSGVFRKFGSITTNIGHLTLNRFKAVWFPLPPLAEQQRIVAEADRRLSLIRVAEAQVSANLARAQRLRQSILQAAFAAPVSGVSNGCKVSRAHS